MSKMKCVSLVWSAIAMGTLTAGCSAQTGDAPAEATESSSAALSTPTISAHSGNGGFTYSGSGFTPGGNVEVIEISSVGNTTLKMTASASETVCTRAPIAPICRVIVPGGAISGDASIVCTSESAQLTIVAVDEATSQWSNVVTVPYQGCDG